MKGLYWSLLVFALNPGALWAQSILILPNHPIPLPRPVPRPPEQTYHIESLTVDAAIREQVASVQVSQTFVNSGKGTIEAQLVFPLPYDGAIDQLTLMVNGKEYPAKLLKASEARERYEAIVRSQRDPALLEWIGTGMFQTSVFPIPAGEKRTVTIHYSQLLRRNQSLTDFLFPLSTAKFTSKPIEQLKFRLTLDSQTPLKNIYSPTHPVDIKRDGEQRAVITYEKQNSVPKEDFRLLFDARSGTVNATLLTYHPQGEDHGYFLLLATPDVQATRTEPQSKTISFVIDKSGSMSGKKIEQVREAAKFVLRNLRERDLFNILSYDAQVTSFRPELESFNEESRKAAEGFVESLFAGGSTNIHDAALQALGQLKDDKRPNFVLFLTDGVPTASVTNESQIAAAVRKANTIGARLLVFGVGYDVNSRLLDRLSRENRGISEYVRPDEDLEAVVARVFQRIGSPILTDATVRFEIAGTESPVNRVYPSGALDLFAGEQLVVVGRYKQSGETRIRLRGQVSGEPRDYEFTGSFAGTSADRTNSFIEKLWATRRIGEIIDEIDLNGRNPELIAELVELSTKHGILTPYTSFLADDNVRPEMASTANQARATQSTTQLNEASGQSGFEQRSMKSMFKGANQAYSGDGAFSPPGLGGGPQPRRPGAVFQQDASPAPAKARVFHVGTQTMYRRGKLLMTPETASIDLDKDREKYQVVQRFSPEYFAIIQQNSKAENDLLSQQGEGDELLVRLGTKVVLIR
ncbi:VIT domain-containing protein [Planctomicrobium sp. SH664]|uniref:VIT domain-containing protein n=1 Tax=Planctomicrobium sp. SH664 TaxID=3448125 RepID=UPI003F5C8981